MEKGGGFGFACRGGLAMLVCFDDGKVLQRGDIRARLSPFFFTALMLLYEIYLKSRNYADNSFLNFDVLGQQILLEVRRNHDEAGPIQRPDLAP